MQSVAGDYRTQFYVKAETIAAALSCKEYDFGFLHIKAVDDTGHDQQPVLKVRSLPDTDFCSLLHIHTSLFRQVAELSIISSGQPGVFKCIF